MADVKRIRVGLLGGGRIARRFHLRILAALPGVALVAVAESIAEARAACHAIAPRAALFASYSELLGASRLDAVVICLPPALHAEAAVASFERQLHVYLEKPLATSLDEAIIVVEAWRRAGTTGMIGFNYRFHPLVRAMQEALTRGSIGGVTTVRASFGAAHRTLPEWKRERSSGGGVLLDLASHHVDLARFLFDTEIVEVSALVRSTRSDGDTAVAALRLLSGPMLSLCVSLAGVEEDRIEVTGSRGQLVFDRYRSSRLQWLPVRRDYRATARLKATVATVGMFPGVLRDALLPPRERTFALALDAFVAAIRDGRAAAPDLDDGLASLAVVMAAERSAREGVKVVL
jgi:myo-inositol 2-dehydrogenase/D-chiro-inositol 1-dehydrogenase